MKPYFEDDSVTVYAGDCLDVMREIPDASVDSVVCDPPYNLAFMGRDWDSHATVEEFERWCESWARECLRLLKPGGYLLAFGGTRTYHRLACGIEDAGFDIRDSIGEGQGYLLAWVHGTGFPKSRNVTADLHALGMDGPDGLGTALKPAWEPIVLARKPLVGTVAQNVITFRTGALNIDGCRIEATDERKPVTGFYNRSLLNRAAQANDRPWMKAAAPEGQQAVQPHEGGRWPTNVVLDEWYEPVIRLRDNLPVDVERTIREFFDASTSHLPAVSRADIGATEQGEAPQVLYASLPGGMDVGEPDWGECTPVQQAAFGRVAAEDECDQEGEGAQGRKEPALEWRHIPEPGVCDGQIGSVDNRGANAVCLDGHYEQDARGLHPGASAGSGPDVGPSTSNERACPSHQRGEGRQPTGESGDPLQRGASQDSRRGRARTLSGQGGESHAARTPLELLRSDVPGPWLRHFADTGRSVRSGAAAELDRQSGTVKGAVSNGKKRGTGFNGGFGEQAQTPGYNDHGGASRFFPVFKYEAKAGSGERPEVDGVRHPTVKPLDLMRWLVRLVTPPGGLVLDPFAGSGTTAEACVLEHMRCIAIEREPDYLPLIVSRLSKPMAIGFDFGEPA